MDTRHAIDLTELTHFTTTDARRTFTVARTGNGSNRSANRFNYDFLTLISLVSDSYRVYGDSMMPMQPFQRGLETYESGGLSCIVTRRAIAMSTPSSMTRGELVDEEENIVVKRVKRGLFDPSSPALKSFIAELRIRAHPPLRDHQNIAKLKGVAWDFEDEERKKPRPLLLEEFASEGSLTKFWTNNNLTRMPFKEKVDLGLDIAQGLLALHKCGVVHGDIKPDNILIFSNAGSRTGFTAKLTDFGHSVFVFENRSSLPAFTLPYSAPEATEDLQLTFEHMKLTDVYSYGLVISSLVVGRDCCTILQENLAQLKSDDLLLDKILQLVEEEDRIHSDSDLDLATLRLIFMNTIRLECKKRKLDICIKVLTRYQNIQNLFHKSYQAQPTPPVLEDIETIPQTLFVGYQALSRCSHLLKERVFQELEFLAQNTDDVRSAAACWELCVCYFAGFGVSKDVPKSCSWLAEAAKRGMSGARAYYYRLHKAMEVDPDATLRDIFGSRNLDPLSVMSGWLLEAASCGYVDILPDLQRLDVKRYNQAREIISQKLGETTQAYDEDQNALLECVEFNPGTPDELALATEITLAAANGQLSKLKSLVEEAPHAINFQDENGNTALICAARCKRFLELDFLLSCEDVDGSICNWRQQNALHFLENFTEEEIKNLVPRLVNSKADVAQQAVSVEPQWGDAPELRPRIRCDPMLQAVLGNNAYLLKQLLKAVHSPSAGEIQCKVCESGSCYRKLIAWAIRLQHFKAIKILQSHQISSGTDASSNFGSIEVWYNQELLPAWNLVYRGRSASVVDLPESFCRALTHGEWYRDSLRKTLQLLWKQNPPSNRQLYKQLQQSVIVGNVEAIEYIMEEARSRARPIDWWSMGEVILQSPILMSIKLGFRDVFDMLWSADDQVLHHPQEEACAISPCSKHSFKRGYLWPVAKHHINMAQIALSLAAVAPHHDDYFLSFMLDRAPRDKVLAPIKEYDERRSFQSTSFLAQAILADSFSSAKLILEKYPDSLHQKVYLFPYPLRQKTQDYYTIPSYCEGFDLDLDEGSTVLARPLVHYILFLGSYRQTAFILRHLRDPKVRRPSRRRFRPWCRPAFRNTDGGSSWDDLMLTDQEYRHLLLGLTKANRNDRHQLWEVVSSQVAKGHDTNWYYLRLALFHANSRAVKELLARGWAANGPLWIYFMTPLSEAKTIVHFTSEEEKDPSYGIFEAYQRLSRWNADAKDSRYYSSEEWFEETTALRIKDAQTNVDTLVEYHASTSVLCGKYRLLLLVLLILGYLTVYLVLIPIILFYAHVLPDYSSSQRLGWIYCYTLLAMLIPPLPLVVGVPWAWTRPGMRRPTTLIRYRIIPVICIANHVGLLFALIKENTAAPIALWVVYLSPLAMGIFLMVWFAPILVLKWCGIIG